MKTTTTLTTLVLASCYTLSPTAWAADPHAVPAAAGTPSAEHGPPKAGPETQALAPLAGAMVWTGSMKPNAMGPGSSETPAHGKSNCKWILNNLWLSCEIEDIAGKGKQAMEWRGHMQLGYDVGSKIYRAVVVDNWGMATLMNGQVEGAKLTLESAVENQIMGQALKLRLVWDWSDPKAIKFTDERSIGGAPFVLSEEATLKRGR